MMDQSFDAFAGGGGAGNGWSNGSGDQSFIGGPTQAATSKTTDYERVPLPITVETLNTLDAADEKIVYGNYSFSTVRLVAEIVETVEQSNMTDVRYMVRDRGQGHQTPFMIVQYFGIDGADITSFVEGTIVHVVGKIRNFDNRATIVAYKVLEVVEMGFVNVFPKEAKFAELFFKKNIPERITSGTMDHFRGTMLSAEAPPSNHRSANNATASMVSRPSFAPKPQHPAPGLHGQTNVYGNTQATKNRGNNPQQNRIIEFFETHVTSPEEGHSRATIRIGVRGDVDFDDDLRSLAENGIIFSTLDDEHWSLI